MREHKLLIHRNKLSIIKRNVSQRSVFSSITESGDYLSHSPGHEITQFLENDFGGSGSKP